MDTLEVAGDNRRGGNEVAEGCQTDIAAKIREKKANYVLSVKKNQPMLYQNIKDYFDFIDKSWGRHLPTDVWRSGEERRHGRVESREVWTENDIGWLEGREKAATKLPERPRDYHCVPEQEGDERKDDG